MTALTWRDRVRNLTEALGRKPEIEELLAAAEIHKMTPAEIEEQRQSFFRGLTTPCEHGELDFEQCPECRPPAPSRSNRVSGG